MSGTDSLIECLVKYAKLTPSHQAFVTSASTLSYAELAQRIKQQVTVFHNAGVSADSVVGIYCADDVKHLILCLAAMHIGATSCTIPTYEKQQTQQDIINRCKVTHIANDNRLIEAENFKSLANMADPVEENLNGVFQSVAYAESADQAHILFFTSGTTGQAKVVVHQDSDLVEQAHRHISSHQERFVCLASVEHNFAKRHRLYCLAMGATNIFIVNHPQLIVTQCLQLEVNVMHVSAFQAQELLATKNINQLANIRLKLGGSHVPLPLRQQLRNNITQNLQAGYGTTETGAIGFTKPDDLHAAESVGQPLPGIEIRVVTPQRKTLDVGEPGEIAIRCKGMFRGYLNQADLTAERLENGWFYTGDIGYLDEQQRIYLCGRADDMFVFNSINIYPQDIESQICQHPNIVDAAVLPKKSPVHGNIPVALVVFAKNVKPDLIGLKQFVKKRVGIRSPRQYTLLNEIPRNTSGKISRREIVSIAEKDSLIRSSIIDLLVDAKAINHIKPSLIAAFKNGDKDISLDDIAMDSIIRMELLVVLETTYDAIITPQQLAQCYFLGDIVFLVISASCHDESAQNIQPLTKNIDLNQADVPHVVRLFQRTFRYCRTVAQLRKAFATLEYRLTPMEVECLFDWHAGGQLIPANAAEKFQAALTAWLKNLKRIMLANGKQNIQPFFSRKINSVVTLFAGPGEAANKTLLICFSVVGGRGLMIPNAVLLQHMSATVYDLLVIAEPLAASYRSGVPTLGNNLTEVVEWLARLDLLADYKQLRTFGSSAGGYPAILAGYRIGAELAISMSGRYPWAKHKRFKILQKIYIIWRVVRRGKCGRALLSYGAANGQDRRFARMIARLARGNQIGVKFNDENANHVFLQRLSDRGELMPYLQHTLFAKMSDKLIAPTKVNVMMSFPGGKITPYEQ